MGIPQLRFKNMFLAQKSHIKLLGKAISISVLNQGVSSASNFLFGVYLVRVLSPTDFGLYGIGFAISLFYAGTGNALLLTQMVVHTPDKASTDQIKYAGRILIILSIFCLGTLLIVGTLTAIAPELFGKYLHFTYAVSAAAITYLLKEFFIRHAYNIHKEIQALLIHSSLASTLGVLILMSYIYQFNVNVELATACYAFAHLVAVLTGLILAKLPFHNINKDILETDIKECWIGGKWAFVTNIVYFLRIQAHTIIVAASVGPIGVGYLNAARLFVTPAVMLTPALGQIFMPRLATARAKHPQTVLPLARMLTGILLGVAIAYSMVLMLSFSAISPLLLGDRYTDSTFWLVAGWCVVSCLLALRNGAEMTAQVLKQFDQLAKVNSISAVITLIFVYVLLNIIGIIGSLIGLAIGEITLIILVWQMLTLHTNINKL